MSILTVLALFSVGVYFVFGQNLDVDVQYQGNSRQEERELEQKVISETNRSLVATLIAVDLGATGVAVVIGWLLAGAALAPLLSAFEGQKQFVSDAAHELRTPLSIIKAGLETLEVGGEPRVEDFKELNKDLLIETNRLVDLTSDLLLLAGADNLASAAKRKNVDISVIAEKEIRLTQPYAKEAGVSIKTKIEPSLTISARKSDMERVILNLLKNAVDYNSTGGEVELRVQRSGTKTVLGVSDNGIGLDKDQLSNVFDRFYKADTSRERTESGAGLGLSIVRELVELNGGQVEIESQVGVGTKVTIVFA